MLQDQAQDVAHLRTERHPNADLLSALINEITDNAVQSDHCQQQREGSEDSHQGHQEFPIGDAAIYQEFNRADLPHRLIGIDFPDGLAHGLSQA